MDPREIILISGPMFSARTVPVVAKTWFSASWSDGSRDGRRMAGVMPSGREIFRKDFNENVSWWTGKTSTDWCETCSVSNGSNSRSQLTGAGKCQTHSERVKCGELGQEGGKGSWSPNGKDLEQEEFYWINQGETLKGLMLEVKWVPEITWKFEESWWCREGKQRRKD